jgi:hypothetical protein
VRNIEIVSHRVDDQIIPAFALAAYLPVVENMVGLLGEDLSGRSSHARQLAGDTLLPATVSLLQTALLDRG